MVLSLVYCSFAGLFEPKAAFGQSTEGSSPSDPQNWKSLQVKFARDYTNREGCYSYEFWVESDGSFSAKPCGRSNNTATRGEITAAELNELNQLTRPVLFENLEYTLSCEDWERPILGGYSLAITSPSETEYGLWQTFQLISETWDGQPMSCVRGPEVNYEPLSDYLTTLLQKYIPSWRPE
jgi:hypothetical protein